MDTQGILNLCLDLCFPDVRNLFLSVVDDDFAAVPINLTNTYL